MRCVTCGAELPPDSQFCEDCGAPVAAQCPSCGAAVAAGKAFCRVCGTRLAATRSTAAEQLQVPAAQAPVAERRICSILFVDLVGFTPLAEKRDPEEVRELLSRYFESARTLIERYGGVVEKFIGDAVMAVWGAPVAKEGDAERAVRAALDVVAAVAQLGEEAGVTDLRARAGVVTGEVAVTVGKEAEGMVLGDTVNTASRVQSVAPPGGVLVDEATQRVARGGVAFSAAGEHELKGKSEPVALFRAERVLAAMGGAQRFDGLEAPLVGRDAELRVIKESFHACIDRRSPRLVAVSGPAGVGKSRLGWEFEKYVDGLAATIWWHRGRCLSYGDGVAFWALAEMVRQRLSIAEEEPLETAGEKLRAGLSEWVPDATLRDYIEPRLARLLGVDTTGQAFAREELYAGWRAFFEQLATTAPVVLVVEDLHYADSGLLDFLEHLLDWARDVPVFVLSFARPELEDRRAGFGAGRRNATTLALEPLGAQAMDEMLEGLVPEMPEPAKQAIAAHAQGIPLYAVETVRMLVDRGVVRPFEGTYRLVGDVGELSVPESLQSLLAARLDSLSPEARALVADSSVLGGTFPVEALVAVSGLAEDVVRKMLSDLVRREVLAVRADPLSPERGQYGFVQLMVRQVAYETLSRRERKARHLAVADHLERTFPSEGEEVSEVIASHLLDAMEAVPDDPDVLLLRERASSRLARAAERATRMGAPATAARIYDRAAEINERTGTAEADLEAARFVERAAYEALRAGEDWHSAAVFCERAAALYTRLELPRDAARATVGLGDALRHLGEMAKGRRVTEEALQVLEPGQDAETVHALSQLAAIATFAGDADAGDLIESAFDLAQALDLGDTVFAALFVMRGIHETTTGDYRESVADLREAARLSQLAGDHLGSGRALGNLADVLLAVDPAGSADAARQALAHLRRAGGRRLTYAVVINLIQALILVGSWREAEAVLADAATEGLASRSILAWVIVLLTALRDGTSSEALASVELFATSEDPQDLASVSISHALASWAEGDMRGAFESARETLAHAGALGLSSEYVRWGWPLAAEAALRLGNRPEVNRLLDWLDGHPEGQIPRVLRAERLRIRARLEASGADGTAGARFEEAVAAFRELGSPYHLAVGLLDRAEYCSSIGEHELARELAAEAEEIAGELASRPLVRRASALLRGQETASAPEEAAVGRS